MRKLLSLFVAALFSVTMFAADSYTAAGSSAVLFGKTWDAAVVANDLSLVEGTTYQLVKEGVELPAVTIQFKICEDHKWDKAYPASNYDLDIVESGIYDVTITFDASKGNEGVSAVAEKKGEAVVVPSVAIKGSWDAKGAYDATWNGGAAYDFKIAEDKKTASYACTLTSLTDYNFGLEIGGAWRSNGAITIDREHSSVNFVAGSDNAKLTVDAAGEYTFTWTYETGTLVVTYPEKGEGPQPIVLPVVALAGTMNGWNVTANVLTPAKDSLSASVVVELEAGKDTLKIVSDGKWLGKSNNEGLYSMHREWNHVDHFDLINSAAGNVELVADVAGEYTFTWTYADSTLVVTFPAAPFVPEPEYFLVRASNEWAVVEADKFAATETEGEFKLAATLVLDDEIKVLGIAGEDTTWYPDGMGNAFEITEKFAGEHDIYFRPAGNDDWKSFHEGGFFWMGANPDPEPELVELNLVPGPWVDGSNAKIAAWIWGEKLAGEWTEFIGLEGDTLKFNVKETADSIIFVRFHPETEAPAWYNDGKLWNRMPNEEIDYIGKTYTITAYDKGQWEPYIITPFNLYLALGKWAEPDEKARYAIYTIDNAKWIDLAAVEGKEDVLFAEVPGTITQVVFCRMNPEALENDWKNIWNQTADLLIPEGKDQFTITGWGEGEGAKSEGVWSKYGEEPLPVVAEYFFIGSRIEWSVPALTEDLKFTLNEGAEVEEYKLDITLVAGEYFKVVKLEGETQTWFIEGDDKARLVAEEEAGDATIYFRPEANPSWAETDLGGHIYIHKAATGVEETAVEGKAVKALRDGQLVIIKNGVRYNVIGIRF